MWMCPEKTRTLCSCPVSFGYQGPTGIPILGVSFSKGSKGRKTYLEKFPTLLCVALRDWASQCSLASIIVIYALAFGRVCVCCWALAPHRRLTYFMHTERPDASTVHWRSGPPPIHLELSQTHTNSTRTRDSAFPNIKSKVRYQTVLRATSTPLRTRRRWKLV